ncbi:MAG: GDP-mannose 4,6-dehydratase [Acidobacteriaceae bacterium]
MRVLITGGAGFIGSHLTEKLLSLGWNVTCIDDLSTGSIDNLSAVRDNARFLFYADTIFNRRLTTNLISDADVVFHLAAAVGVKRIVDFPVQTIETNVEGTEIVLEAAAARKKRIFIASTSEVYGKSTKIPFSENDDLVLGSTYNSRWAYACSKAIDEFLALAYHREKDLPVTLVRFFNTVGPRQTGRYGMVLPNFVRQALLHQPVTVYGSGEQTRCFGHVSDIIQGLLLLLDNNRTVSEIFNLGNTEEISINNLARKVIAACDSRSEIVHVPYSEAYGPGFEDMFRRVPDISKAREWLGYEPCVNLDAIIQSVVEYERVAAAAREAV